MLTGIAAIIVIANLVAVVLVARGTRRTSKERARDDGEQARVLAVRAESGGS
jgi:hypothetical protein